MQKTILEIVENFTIIDDLMKDGGRAIIQFSIDEIFKLGQYHQWALQYVNNDKIDDFEQLVHVDNEFSFIFNDWLQ